MSVADLKCVIDYSKARDVILMKQKLELLILTGQIIVVILPLILF